MKKIYKKKTYKKKLYSRRLAYKSSYASKNTFNYYSGMKELKQAVLGPTTIVPNPSIITGSNANGTSLTPLVP